MSVCALKNIYKNKINTFQKWKYVEDGIAFLFNNKEIKMKFVRAYSIQINVFV